MKTFFVSLTSFVLYSCSLAAYSNIPEAINTPSSYSNISSYPDYNSYSSSKGEVLEPEHAPLNENEAVAANSRELNEDTGAIQETNTIEENTPIMMASEPLAYSGVLRVDDDGCGYWHQDPDHKDQTSFIINGASLNADINSYVVVPSYLLNQGVKLGSRADVSITFHDSVTGVNVYTETISSIVGDVGPNSKGAGEVSVEAARELGFGIQDVSGVGPVTTWGGVDYEAWTTVTYYP